MSGVQQELVRQARPNITPPRIFCQSFIVGGEATCIVFSSGEEQPHPSAFSGVGKTQTAFPSGVVRQQLSAIRFFLPLNRDLTIRLVGCDQITEALFITAMIL